jgi:hypothetical protein
MIDAPAYDIEAEELRQREFFRLAGCVVPTLDSLRSLTPKPFRAAVALMLERLGHELITDASAAYLVTTKNGSKFVTAFASPAVLAPTAMRDVPSSSARAEIPIHAFSSSRVTPSKPRM